jgi:hypothetical protein
MSEQSIQLPDGYFYQGYEIYGHLGQGGIISRGYVASFPDLSASDPQAYLDLQTDLRMMLARVGAEERIQIQYFTSNEFGEDVDRFEGKTLAANCPDITRSVRTELVERYRDRMQSGKLIKSNVRIFFSTRIEKLQTESGKRIRGFKEVFKVIERSFDQRAVYVNLLLKAYGGGITPMDNMAHYRDKVGYWSPAALPLLAGEPDWFRTIQELSQFSEISHRQSPDHGLCIDGYYYGLMVFKSMPGRTRQTTMDPFLHLAIPGLRVVVNAVALDVESEMRHEEARFSKLMSNIDVNNPSLVSEVGLDKHRDRMRRLMSAQTIPYSCQIIVLARDRTADGLDKKMEGVRAVIAKTGAEWHRPMVPTSVLGFYNCGVPGIGLWVKYSDFWHRIDDKNLANMLPTGSSPKADLERADWICDNDCNGLMGGRFFSGQEPLHWLILGTTGSGKSVLTQLLLLQALMFRLAVVIDNGLSYVETCRRLDPRSRPLIITSKGGYCFNIFDTSGGPLSSHQKNAATSLCHLLVGRSQDEDRDKLRHAILSEAISELYASRYRRWRNANPEMHFEVCQEAAAALGITDPDAALALDRNPETEHLTRNLAFKYFTAKEFPTLSTLQDFCTANANQKGPHQEVYAGLATLLRPWLRGGNYGEFLDGPSNFTFGTSDIKADDPLRIVHLELGKVAQDEPELLDVAGFIIISRVLGLITSMPRDIAKQIVIEELSSFLDVPDGAKVVKSCYQTARKYSTQIVSVAQQYSGILDSDSSVANAIIGNSSGLFLLRNQNRDELNRFSQFIKLPEPVKDRIQRFPKPEDQRGQDDAHSGFCYVSLTEAEPKFTIGRLVLSDEVEQMTSSSGVDFERRQHVEKIHSNGDGRNGNGELLDAETAKYTNGESAILSARQ